MQPKKRAPFKGSGRAPSEKNSLARYFIYLLRALCKLARRELLFASAAFFALCQMGSDAALKFILLNIFCLKVSITRLLVRAAFRSFFPSNGMLLIAKSPLSMFSVTSGKKYIHGYFI
jgi:hypothetical protein